MNNRRSDYLSFFCHDSSFDQNYFEIRFNVFFLIKLTIADKLGHLSDLK
tara:strand:- start:357 stop:503 length:147 start_codon:yes stop_codon:yes gene_type:complete